MEKTVKESVVGDPVAWRVRYRREGQVWRKWMYFDRPPVPERGWEMESQPLYTTGEGAQGRATADKSSEIVQNDGAASVAPAPPSPADSCSAMREALEEIAAIHAHHGPILGEMCNAGRRMGEIATAAIASPSPKASPESTED